MNKNDAITTSKTRMIIEDFAREIENRKTKGIAPKKAVINFRSDILIGKERDIFLVPLELLRYRKDNGRISSDIFNYERNNGILDEKSKYAQEIIEKFLEEKDKEKTDELLKMIDHEGQRDPAIATCDGFLINGNRRKLVLELLHKKKPGEPKFQNMKVVILPSQKDEGGPPTLLEIEQIENRYQLQRDGKAEYSNFDRALSIRRKIECGMSLEQQLRDDPSCAGLGEKQFQSAVKNFEKLYLGPLECIDEYLCHLNREGLYSTVSSGLGDSEGRWQAFFDYYNSVYLKLKDERQRMNLGINDNEVGTIEDSAFKIIRMRDFPNEKVHKIIRDLPKLLKNEDSKKELFKLKEIDLFLPEGEIQGINGTNKSDREIDKIWAARNRTQIIKHVKDAQYFEEHKREKETPIGLMEAALKKLKHEDLKPSNVSFSDYEKAMRIARAIQTRANELETEFYNYHKKLKSVTNKYRT